MNLLRACGVLGWLAAQAPGDAPPAPAPPARELVTHAVTKGDHLSFDWIRRKTLHYEFAGVEGAPDGKVVADVEHVAREAWTDRMLEAADGRPTFVERHVEMALTYERHHATAQAVQTRGALSGQTVRVRAIEGGCVVETLDGKPVAGVPGVTLEPAVCALLPTGPIAPGETWVPGADAVARLLATDGETADATVRVTKAEGRCEAIEPEGGRRVARLGLTLALVATVAGGVSLEATLTGTARVDCTARRLERIDLAGPVTLASPPGPVRPGAPVVQGSGRIEMRLTVTPVAATPAEPSGAGR